ncbi:fatty-acid-binding protein 1-like isoform X2 [Aristolochia californica]|uniref:fatty-acid-binding protein 1-like isoform X2 n=1 Tax=Aristolochia californica TaxID=171875 RepID=UPI0035DCD09A
MVSLRFPFSFSQPPRHPPKSNAFTFFPRSLTVSLAAAVTAGIGAGFSISHDLRNPTDPFFQKVLHFLSPNPCGGLTPWASLSLADNSDGTAVESKTGVSFPTLLKDTQRLLGIGLRKKSIMGLKNVDVYAFGVYADEQEIKNLMAESFGKFSVSELKENKNFYAQILDKDLSMTVRLQIVYGSLNIRSVRNAFEESVGTRLKKFSRSDNKELLQRFTSQFKDGYQLPRGSIIEISREQGYTLRTTSSYYPMELDIGFWVSDTCIQIESRSCYIPSSYSPYLVE